MVIGGAGSLQSDVENNGRNRLPRARQPQVAGARAPTAMPAA
jgi:hypothetical protein